MKAWSGQVRFAEDGGCRAKGLEDWTRKNW